MGRDELVDHILGKECIYLSIYLSIYSFESQSRLKFNGPTDPSLHTTSCFPGGATKGNDLYFGGNKLIFRNLK